MKSHIIRLLCYVALLGVASCTNNSEKNIENSPENAGAMTKEAFVAVLDESEPSQMLPNSGSANASRPEAQKKIIKDGRILLKTKNLVQTKREVDSLVKRMGGYYGQESFHTLNSELRFDLLIRIPSNHFEALVVGLESGSGTISSKEIAARDVTDQFIDLETRLANKRSYLERYRELLKQARNITEILEVEEKIRLLEEEIESTVATLKYLGDQVAYSTLNLEISTPQEVRFIPEQTARFTERLKVAFLRGWYGFVDLVVLLFQLWPLWLIVGGGVWFWIFRAKRKVKRS